MKKDLLLLATALSVGSMGWALDSNLVIPDTQINQISAGGKFAAGGNSISTIITLVNLTTGEVTTIGSDEEADQGLIYSPGMGNYVSDTGIVLGSVDSSGLTAYYFNGEWRNLPLRTEDRWALSQGITPDGTRICGQVSSQNFSADAEEIMDHPVVWDLGANGEYGEYVQLPYPEKDFTGRVPQRCTATWISEDGKLVSGQFTDYSGEVILPILFREESEGVWSYELLWDPNPNGVDLGEPAAYPESVTIDDYVSEATMAAYQEAYDAYLELYDNKPLYIDFVSEEVREELVAAYGDWILSYNYTLIMNYLTDEQLAEYEAAVAQWEADLEAIGGYPEVTNFMTPEELVAYEAAMEDYEAQCSAYFDWMEKVWELEDAIPSFSFNSQCMSAQGKYLATTAIKLDWESGLYETSIYLFDIEAGTYERYPFYDIDYLATFVNDEGYLFASSPINYYDYPRNAFVKEPGTNVFRLLQDYVNDRNPQAYKWMEQEMCHEYYTYDEKGNATQNEAVNTGSACASADLSIIGMWCNNYWDNNIPEYEFSYLIDLNKTDGIATVETEEEMPIEVYDLNGRRLPSSSNLAPGIYIFKQGTTAKKVKI